MSDCGICLIRIKSNDSSIKCSGLCKQNFHGKCVDIKSSHCKLIKEYASLKWFCKNCISSIDFISKIYAELNDFKKDIKKELNILHETIRNKNIDELGPPTKTY